MASFRRSEEAGTDDSQLPRFCQVIGQEGSSPRLPLALLASQHKVLYKALS